jgi:hypothetical protein
VYSLKYQEALMKSLILKIAGIVGIVGGSVALYFAGANEAMVSGLVAGAFVLIGVIAGFFAVKE